MLTHVLTLHTRTAEQIHVVSSRRAARGLLEERLTRSPRGLSALERLLAGQDDRATVGSLTVQLEAA